MLVSTGSKPKCSLNLTSPLLPSRRSKCIVKYPVPPIIQALDVILVVPVHDEGICVSDEVARNGLSRVIGIVSVCLEIEEKLCSSLFSKDGIIPVDYFIVECPITWGNMLSGCFVVLRVESVEVDEITEGYG